MTMRLPLRKVRRYEYVPAAVDSLQHGITLGVRYERNASYEVKQQQRCIRFKLPDRTLFIFYSAMTSAHRFFGTDLDEVVDLSVYLNRGTVSEFGLPYAMVNSAAVTQRYRSRDYDADKVEGDPVIIADSGGFQISSGAKQFLDPQKIIEAQNDLCDVGVVLDIPIFSAYQDKFLLRAAKVQRMNNKVFLANKRDSLSLMNVTHGSTFSLREAYRSIVETDDFDRLAVAGLKVADLMPLALQTVKALTTGKKYKHYHILGASGAERWLILSYIAHKKIAPLITSDSSSYLQSGIATLYNTPERLLYTRSMGSEFKDVSFHRTLPCTCPICSIVKYARPFSDKSTAANFYLTSLHNLWVYARYVDEFYELTAQPKNEIMRYIDGLFNSKKLRDIRLALDAIDMAVQDSPEKAAQRYAPFLLKDKASKESSALFSVDSQPQAKVDFDSVLSGYERHHGKKGK